MVAALDEPYRSTVLLCYGEELSPSEVARRQGIPAGTVRWRLKQGLDRLRSGMDRAHGSRRAWAGLGPVLVPSSALVMGGMLFMNAKMKIAGAAVVIALLAGLAAWWRLGGPPPSARPQTVGPSGAELRRLAEQPPDQQWASFAGRVIDEQGQAVRATVALAGTDDQVVAPAPRKCRDDCGRCRWAVHRQQAFARALSPGRCCSRLPAGIAARHGPCGRRSPGGRGTGAAQGRAHLDRPGTRQRRRQHRRRAGAGGRPLHRNGSGHGVADGRGGRRGVFPGDATPGAARFPGGCGRLRTGDGTGAAVRGSDPGFPAERRR